MEWLWWLVTIALIGFGLIGTVLPLVPGTVLIFGGAVVNYLLLGSIGWPVLAVMAVLMVLGQLLDIVSGSLGAKWFGATRWGAIGGILGAIIGIFFGIIGIFVGPLIGALVGELLAGRGILPAGKSSWGTLIGTTAGIIGKVVIGLMMVVSFLVGLWWRAGTVPTGLINPVVPGLEIFDRHGVPLRAILSDDRAHIRTLDVSELEPDMIHAVLAAEDKRFYAHHGIDWIALSRAITIGVQRWGDFPSGASTISQQLVKIASPGERGPIRKLLEMRSAAALERTWSKDEILAAYLNKLEFGDLQQGLKSAATYYFGKPLSMLSLAECAYLAGIPNAPTRLNPHTNPDGARKRQRHILRRMHAAGWITDARLMRALDEPLVIKPRGHDYLAPHFVDLILRRRGLPHGPVVTTVDLALNIRASEILASHIQSLKPQNVTSGAVVVIDNATSEVLALACHGSDVNLAWTTRSAGSAIKPFTYILAMERGAFPGMIVPDVPTVFATPTGVYKPNNYNHRFHGPVSLRRALGNSLNVAAIRTLEFVGGAEPLQQLLKECGVTTLGHPAEYYGLGLTLGNGGTRLLELANAYAAIARLGEFRPMRLIRNPQENVAFFPSKRVCSPQSAWMVADMLADDSARIASFGSNSYLALPFPAACKTGTSSNYRDNVSIGFTKNFTVAVWVGNPDGSPMQQITGVTGAAPVMHEVLCHLRDRFGITWLDRPDKIQTTHVSPLTGKRPIRSLIATVPEVCVSLPDFESDADYDASGKLVLPEVYREWLASDQNTLTGIVTGTELPQKLKILSPEPGTVFFIDPDIPLERQIARVQTNSDDSHDRLTWRSTTLDLSDDVSGFILKKGKHELSVADRRTQESESTWIEVKEL